MAGVRQNIRAIIDRELSPAARSAKLAQIATDGVAALIASGQAPPRYARYVDGAAGAPETAVRADGGVILYEFAYLGPAIVLALAELQSRSPARSGRYRSSFVVGVNGRPIPAASFAPDSVPPDAEVFIYNSQPYSRLVDIQLIGSRPLKFSVPPGMFDAVARLVTRRYGNAISCKRLSTVRYTGQYKTKAGRPVDSPALVLNLLK